MPSTFWQTLTGATGGEKAGEVPGGGEDTGAGEVTGGDTFPAGGAAPLEDLGALVFEGPDARSFLQGYLTCDMDTLSAAPTLAALCNLKGRVVANGWCSATADDTVVWIVHRSLAEAVTGFMARYLPFSKTRVTWQPDDHVVLGTVDAAGSPAAWMIDGRAALDRLLARAAPSAPDAWHRARLAAGVALVTSDTTETFLPQMLGLVALNAIDFEKGCYLGQEVVARAQHRGQVKRSLHRLTADTPARVGPLTDADGREVGVIVDSHGLQALAVVRDPLPGALRQDGVALEPAD